MDYLIRYACCSHRGLVREMNQDNILYDGRYMESPDTEILPCNGIVSSKKPSLFAVFDGMGGEDKGEMAALLAARCASSVSLGANPRSDLFLFCSKANESICDYAEANGYYSMGTTAALLAFTSDTVTACNVGDSRILRFTHNKLKQLSVDDCCVSPPGVKAPLFQNLGIPEVEMLIEPHFSTVPICDGDLFLICSDGLTDLLDDEMIEKILSEIPFDEVLDRLLLMALSRGGVDNISIILCRIETAAQL